MPVRLKLTDRGFDQYGRVYLPEYEALVKSVGLEIVNSEVQDSVTIAESLGLSSAIVEHVLGTFESRGFIKLFYETRAVDVMNVSPKLRRWLDST